ncbi:hypothetical protein CEXT_77291 [Caerostris extrusa]|uniref:Uncharacterized protein n=1 Tax=Caerostris extrusa TaxID=172846 RepID=A0AAV4UAV8_CAEEX|nr:hypothetical protein CEXT_77291 [Caerostris extrusa]
MKVFSSARIIGSGCNDLTAAVLILFFFVFPFLFFSPLGLLFTISFCFPSANELAEKAANNLVTYSQQCLRFPGKKGLVLGDKLDAFIQSTLAAHGHSMCCRRYAHFRLCSCCD